MNKNIIKKLVRTRLLENLQGGEYEVYHGSETKISKFVDDFVGGQQAKDAFGPGIYFSNLEEDAGMFGPHIHKVILTPRLLFDQSKINRRKLEPILVKLIKMQEDWEMNAMDWDENPEIGLRKLLDSIFTQSNDEKDCLLQVWGEMYRYDSLKYVRNCVTLGIDGIIVKNDNEYNSSYFIIYNPNIIKNIKN